MKKLAAKGFHIVSLIAFLIGASRTAKAQFTNSVFEQSGLYTAMAKDANNNLYVTRVQPSTGGAYYEVEKYSNGSETPVVIYQNLTHEEGDYPWGLAVTSTGNVFISTDFTSSAGAIIELTNSGGNYTASTYQTGRYFTALAVDANDNLYDTEYAVSVVAYAVVKYPANSAPNTAGTTLYTGLKSAAGYTYPTGLAIASNGDVYVADAFSNTPSITDGGHVYKLTAASSYAVSTVSTGNYSTALALDASGNLYSSENSGSGYQLVEYAGGTGTGVPVFGPMHTNGVYYPWGIAIINSGNIFIVDGDDGTHGGEIIRLVTPPATTVSYSSPQVYNVGTPIAPLSPTSTNVAALAYNSFVNVLGTGFASLGGIAVDVSGNVYVSSFGNSTVQKLPVGGGAPVSIGSGFSTPYGLAVDAAGNVYVADFSNAAVKKIPVGGGAPVILGSGFTSPVGVAVDAAGDVFVADYGGNAVKEIPVGGGTIITIGSGFSGPTGVAVDAAGNVYVADYLNNAVKEVPVGGSTPVVLGSGFSSPFGIDVDPEGNLFIADYGDSAVKEIPAGGSVMSLLSGFTTPTGIAEDGSGNLYVADYGNSAVKKIRPVGGYYIWPFLPAGLSFNGGTGILSGTPTAVSPATNYTVTAYNAGGGNKAILNITVNPALPSVSYSSPQAYAENAAITPLAPTSSNVATLGYNGTPVVLGTGFSGATGVAADAAGDVFVADYGNKQVKEIQAGSTTPVVIGSGFTNPFGVAVDAAGDVYVADYGASAVYKIPAGNGTPVTIGSGFSHPTGVAVDAAGNVYIADHGNNAVKKIPAGSNTPVVIGSGFSTPIGIAIDAQGNVYIGDDGNNAVKEIPAGSNTPVVIGSGFSKPYGVAVDASGNVFVDDYGNNAVKEIPAGSTTPISIGSGFKTPEGVAADGAGNVYVADHGNNLVKQIKPVGGYYIGPFLPAGLTFNNTTGVLIGTPTVASLATNYTVTAYNSFGRNAATVNIAVDVPPTISYSGPQTYTENLAITQLTPVSSNVAAQGYNSTPVILSVGFNGPTGVAADAAGDVFVADYGDKQVREIMAGSSAPVVIGSGFTNPFGVAVDAAGDVYVADYGASAVYEIPAGNGTPVTIGSGFNHPTGVAVDAAGDVYVADHANNEIKKIPAGSNTPSVIGSGFSGPIGIAVDASGNVYVGDKGTNSVKEIPAGSNTTVVLASGFSSPYGVAVDASGNVFVDDYGNNAVKEIPAGSTSAIILGGGFNAPEGVAADGAGNVYVADHGTNAVKRIKPAGGYYIGPFLPAGLTFNNTTGVLSGTPTATSPATNYVITAYNPGSGSTANLNITVAGLPILSYASPQTYTENVAITPLTPTGGAVAAPGYNSAPVAVGSGFSGPTGVATDAAGDVFIADYGNKQVKEIPFRSNTPTAIGSGFTNPFGVAADAAGDVYVADYGANAVYEVPAGNGTPITIGSGFSHPTGVAVDAAGDVYIADHGHNAIKKIPVGSTTPVTIGSGFSSPIGIAVDAQGNVYIGDDGNNAVKEIPAGSNTAVVIGSGFSKPYGVAVDASGNVYVDDYGNNAVKEIPAGSTTPIILGAGFKSPEGVAADGAGDVYVADQGNNAIKIIVPVGGYYIGPFLPAGLIFNNTTGILSGTPTAASPATSYTVTAYNQNGASQVTVNITVIGPPAISYTGPQTYSEGTAITPLTPVSSNVAAPGYNDTPGILGTGFSGPAGVAADAAGDVFVADYGNKLVKKIPAGSNTPAAIGSGFTNPFGVAVDAAGDVYVADYGASAVYKIPGGNGTPVTIGSGFSHPTGVAVDAAGDVYVADHGNNAVKKISAGSNTPVAIGSGFSGLIGIAVDAQGNVYVGDRSNNAVKEIPAGSNTPVVIGSGFSSPYGVAVDASGNVFVADYGNNAVKEIPAGSTTPVTLGSGFKTPEGVATDGAGNVYVADQGNNAVKRIKPVGGYYIGPFLPAGLTLNNTTGVLSGTPTASSPATNYTVTAYNTNGGSPAIVNITVLSNNASLSKLVLSSGPLTPVFATGTTSYTASVANTVTSVTVTPTTSVSTATVTVNGTGVTSGTPSGSLPLAVGANTITTVVTAQNGVTTETYTLTVTRASGGADGYDPGLSVTQPTESPTLDDDIIVVHQGISPNGDGINDFLVIDGIQAYPDNKLMIVNRNGQLIYEATGYDNTTKTFDGHSNKNGQMQLPGTYYYQLDYTVKGVTKHKTGFLILKY